MKHTKGFSLIEIAVVLTVVGASALMFMALTSGGSTPTQSDSSGEAGGGGGSVGGSSETRYVNEAQSQLLGFLRSQNRLPCPDTTNDGLENCGAKDEVPARGVLPYRTMGLSQPVLNGSQFPLTYAVYRRPQSNPRHDMDLARLINRFDPLLPNGELTAVSNALDFCHALRNAAAMPLSMNHLRVDSDAPLNQAYALVDPGGGDAEEQGNVLDANNVAGLDFESPGRARSENYDDIVLSMGFNQLSSRVGCPATMARVNGAARAAVVADDIAELTIFFRDFRGYAREVNIDGVIMASVGLATTAAGSYFTVVDAVIAIVQGLNSFGPAAVAAAIPIGASLVMLPIAIAEASYGVASAEISRAEAQSLYDSAVLAEEEARAGLAEKLAAARLEETRARLR